MPTDSKIKLHQFLVDKKVYTKSYDEFDQQFSTPEKQSKLHQFMVGNELYTKDSTAFQGQFFNGVGKKKVDTTTGSKKESFDPLAQPAGEPEEGPIGTGEVIAAQEEKPQAEVAPQGRTSSFLGSINQRFYGLPGEALKAIAIGGSKIGSAIEGEELDAQDNPLYKAGQWYQDQIKEIAPRNKEYQGELQESVGQAIGDLAGLVAGGAIARTATTGSQMAVLANNYGVPVAEAAKMVAKGIISPEGIIGATQMGVSEYEQAKEGGASDEDAFDLFVKNAAVGSVLERMPVQLFWRRLDTVTGGGMKTLLKKGFSGGMEEGITEIMQQAYSNKQAQQVYDETRNIIDGMGEAGGIGFGLGFVLNAMGVRLRGIKGETTVKEDIAEIDKAIALVEQQQEKVNIEADKIQEDATKEEVTEGVVDPDQGELPNEVIPSEKPVEVIEEIQPEEEVVPEEVIPEELPPEVAPPAPEVAEPTTRKIRVVESESDKLFKRGQEIQQQAAEIKKQWHTKQGKWKANTPKTVIAEARKISDEFNEVQTKYEESVSKEKKPGPYAQKVKDLGEQERALQETPTQEGYDALIKSETDFFNEGHHGTPESPANQARFENRIANINESIEGDIAKVDPEVYVEEQYQKIIKEKVPPKKVETKKVETKVVQKKVDKKAELEKKKTVDREVATGKVVLETQDYIPIKEIKGKEVSMEVEIEETGKTETMKLPAVEVQNDIRKRHKILEKLIPCVG